MISVQDGYLTMFWFIDSFYWESMNDDLGSLLGELSPITFKGYISVDPAAWDIWNKVVHQYKMMDSNKKYITDNELMIIIERFLDEYSDGCFDLAIVFYT